MEGVVKWRKDGEGIRDAVCYDCTGRVLSVVGRTFDYSWALLGTLPAVNVSGNVSAGVGQ